MSAILEPFKKMSSIFKVIRLSQKLRDAEPSHLTLCLGIVGHRLQKKYCQIHHFVMYVSVLVINHVDGSGGHFTKLV